MFDETMPFSQVDGPDGSVPSGEAMCRASNLSRVFDAVRRIGRHLGARFLVVPDMDGVFAISVVIETQGRRLGQRVRFTEAGLMDGSLARIMEGLARSADRQDPPASGHHVDVWPVDHRGRRWVGRCSRCYHEFEVNGPEAARAACRQHYETCIQTHVPAVPLADTNRLLDAARWMESRGFPASLPAAARNAVVELERLRPDINRLTRERDEAAAKHKALHGLFGRYNRLGIAQANEIVKLRTRLAKADAECREAAAACSLAHAAIVDSIERKELSASEWRDVMAALDAANTLPQPSGDSGELQRTTTPEAGTPEVARRRDREEGAAEKGEVADGTPAIHEPPGRGRSGPRPGKLRFDELRTANVARVPAFGHTLAGWTPLEWAGALCGEAGEAANVAKKIRRLEDGCQVNAPPARTLDRMLGEELADVVIYADLLGACVGIDLGEAVVRKFNEVSDRVGSEFKLRPEPSGDPGQLAQGEEIERLRNALRSVAICEQDERPPPGDSSPFDWRRRSEKQEEIARQAMAMRGSMAQDHEVERLRDALRRIAGVPDSKGLSHGARLHDVGGCQREAADALGIRLDGREEPTR